MSRYLARITLVVLFVLPSCAPVDAGAAPPGSELPGWYGVPEEPANDFAGEARLRLVQGGLAGELTLADALARPMYFAMKWRMTEPQVITAVIDPSVSTSFSAAAFEPPLSARVQAPGSASCFTAEGRLLAYALRRGATAPDPALDELVGVGFKPAWLFPFQQSGYNQRITWSSCQVGTGDLMPMEFQFDPRFKLALCDEAEERTASVCGQPPLDRTRIHAMSLSVSDEGRVFLSASFVAYVDEPVTYAVNGVSFQATAGQLKTTLADGPWRDGRNTVEIRQGARAPWSAEVILPVQSLRPRLHEAALRDGDTFTVSWDEARWAQAYLLLSYPLDVPAARVPYPSWSTEQPSVTQTFPGFSDGAGGLVQSTRAMLMLRVSAAVASPSTFAPFHSGRGYAVQWSEGLGVAVAHAR
ncbi:MAG: hypothetical protein Q8L48_43070 [Archangium sp.]|nr:hypothetical protein [Archangium sp.]